MNVGTPVPFAQRISSIVHWRSCTILPGACGAASLYTVWIESTISSPGDSDSACRRAASKFVSVRTNSPSPATPRRAARSLIWRADSSPDR